ncbi:unnamed protein product [Urochloa humidicola]
MADIVPNTFRQALDKITSSIASTTANYGIITRVLSFTGGSFNDRTSLLLDPELGPAPAEGHPAPPAAQAQEAEPAPATTAAAHAFDIEAAAAPLQATSAGDGRGGREPAAARDDAESKRVAKSVYTVCLFVASASLVLFGNLPGRGAASKPAGAAAPAVAAAGESGAGLYIADLVFISLGFFSSLGLSMFSIVAGPGVPAAVAAVQKWGMVVAVASVIVAFALRMGMMLPEASL